MSVRAKVFSIITGLTLIAIIGMYFAFHTVLLRNYDEMDRTVISQHLDRAVMYVNDDVANLNTVNMDWATWDDSYNFMEDNNPLYVAANLVPSIFENLGLDVILYVDNAGAVAWQGQSALDGISDIPAPMLDELKSPGSGLYPNDGEGTTGFINLDGQTLMVVSNPILTSNGDGPARGFLVWASYITADYGQSLSQKTLTDIKVIFKDSDDTGDRPSQLFVQLQNQKQIIETIDNSQITGYELVSDLNGQPMFVIQAVAPRDFLVQGNSAVDSMSLAMGLVLAAIGLGFFVILGRTVVAPISNLSKSVAVIDLKNKEKHRVAANGKDEIASLGRAINTTLDRLENYQKALVHAAEEWRTTFDSINDPISIQDNNHNFLRVNKAFARLYGMEVKDIIGKKCYAVVHGTNFPPPTCPHMGIQDCRKPTTIEYYDGKRDAHFEMSMAPIIDDEGKAQGVVQITKDITERKKMEGRLIVTDRLASLGEMAAGIAHEINNPLTGVVGFTEMLLEEDLPEKTKADIRIIAEGANRVAEIVKRMLTFARQTKPIRTRTDINELIESTLALQIYALKTSNIEIERQLDPDLPWITVDPGQLQQVFLNLVMNSQFAMKKAHGRGTLTVTTSRDGEQVIITFADDGPGIPGNILNKLFQPFFTTKEPGEGTGLGLSLSRAIILEHGGTLEVISEPDNGAKFVIALPVVATAEIELAAAVMAGEA